MKYKKKQASSIIFYFCGLFSVIFLLFVVASSKTTVSYTISNVNTVKSVETVRIKEFNDNLSLLKKEPEVMKINSIADLSNRKDEIIEFNGTLTGYGPDCPGCGGKLGCSPYTKVTDGNIYYNDDKYGKVRILAADKAIPCGSVVKIHNFDSEDFYGIVLDRGSAINGLTMDLLYESEKSTESLGRAYNVDFRIERWGY